MNSWLDQDESGDYDPSSKTHRKRITTSKGNEKTSSGLFHSNKHSSPRLIQPGLSHGRRTGLRCPVILRIGTEALKSRRGLDLVESLKNSPDNWPDLEKYNDNTPNFTELSSGSIRPARLRSYQRLTNIDLPSESTPLNELSLGHPAARGCKACYELGISCDLLGDGVYPCRECRAIDEDCELITEPPKKRGCKQCTRRRIVRSFRHAKNHSGACQQCRDKSFKCIAGPKNGRTRTGPPLDRVLSSQKHRFKKDKQSIMSGECIECSESGGYCSLECEIGTGKCMKRNYSYFVDGAEPATPEQQPSETTSPEPKRRRKNYSLPVPIRHPDSDAGIEMASKQGVIKTIRTKLAHPVRLNCYSSGESGLFCHICYEMSYGILGFPERYVEVIDYQDGKGYIEIESGHTGDGIEPTRLYKSCTECRLRIAKCPDHDLQPIPQTNADNFEYGSVDDYLRRGEAAKAPFQWCSVCPSPAFYACQTFPLEGYVDKSGCGLLLCEQCTVMLICDFSGDLTSLIASKEMDEEGPLKLRADAPLLRRDGQIAFERGVG